jgi:hypothetical protein
MKVHSPCFIACTVFGIVVAIAGFTAIVVATPPDAMLLQAQAAAGLA